jgi:uncharacterized OB-fold protein
MTEPLPGPGPDAEFQRHLTEGRFYLQHCGDCDHWVFPPRVICPTCQSLRLEWRQASGQGRIYSRTVVKRRPEKGGDYAIVLVDLEEGPRIMSHLPDVAPDDVAIGQSVAARIAADGDQHIVVFDRGAGS